MRPTINQESAGTIHFTAAQAAGVTAKLKPFSSNRCQLQRIVRSWLFYLVVTPKGISFDHDNHSFASLLRCELSLLAPRSREPLRLLAAHFTLHNSIDEIIISLCNSITARPNDPKLSHGHWKVTPKCNRDNQISYHRRKLKGQWPLAPARC